MVYDESACPEEPIDLSDTDLDLDVDVTIEAATENEGVRYGFYQSED